MPGYGKICAAVVCTALLVDAGSTALASTAAVPATGVASAKQCAQGHSLSAGLGGKDLALIKGFVVCLGKQWAVSSEEKSDAGSGAGGFDTLGGPADILRTLHSFAADPKVDSTSHFILSHIQAVTNKHYARCFAYTLWDTAPPAPSLTTIARGINAAHSVVAKAWQHYQGGFERSTALVEKGAFFHDGSPDNVRLAVVFMEADPRGSTLGQKNFAC